ncbi:hypothetical protein L6452_15113 [Arctium lappa]|uniref:Uncharacterized protein n=1 Tax=Arctium lappa TaxID=4217 RepID=A0ACB9CMZ4_ARCLA|nr:hypothetical protein L6452_15113 [Arctium lappa]
MAKVSDSSSTEIPTEVMSNLCSKTCMETVKRYRDHNQKMSDDLKRLEKDIKDYVRIVERFEEQIKSFQANELQHSYDTNYWKWEKKDLELQLKKSKEENENIKSEFEKAKLDIEKFSNASKAMDSLLQTQIHDKLRRGIGYNTTPPPYNNNYIPPISDLLETKERKELPVGATKVDPLDKVVVETDSEEESTSEKSKENTVSGEIPLENNIITNEGCGKAWIKSKDIEKTEGKSQKVHYKQTTVVNPVPCKQCSCNKSEPQKHDKPRGNQRNWNNQWAQKQGVDLSKINRPKPCFICGKLNHLAKHCYFNPINQRVTVQRQPQNSFGYRNQRRDHMAESRAPIRSHTQNKFAKPKKNTPNKPRSNLKTKKANNLVQVWVPIVKKPVSTAIPDSTANRNSATATNTTANKDSASARQKTSTNKRSNDPSIGGNTPGEGEDIYNYDELMETMGNINQDVIKQGKEIEEMKLVILSQQVQITKLKKMVTRLLQKKRRKQCVLKRRPSAQDASNKGEKQENETVEKKAEVEGETEEEMEKETELGLSVEEMEIAETLVKAKNDTPKASQKAKGVVIKEGGISEQEKEKEILKESKGKGKEKVIEVEMPPKQKSQIEMDEAIAKQLQDQMEKEEQLQTETDRELARIMAKKLNAEYQKSLKEAAQTTAQVKKLQVKRMPMQKQKQKRQPSKTFLANQERRKMINFLKGAIGVKGEMFTHMAYSQVEELYNKEMAKLQGDSAQREEAERRMKERHDLNIQQPFPEETTPSKEEAEEKKEEPGSVGVEAKAGKRVKTIASKRQSKRPRVEETAGTTTEHSEASIAESDQLSEQSSEPTDENMDTYMTIVEPLKADPISMQAPEIIFWDILRDNGKNFFRIKRADGSFEAYSTWGRVIRSCSRADMEELYKVGMKLYEPVLKGTEENLLKVTLEYLCMMFDPERVHHRIKDHKHEFIFKKIDKWILFENCGVYMITVDNCYHEYYLVDKIYEHSKEKLEGMLKATLVCTKDSEMAKIVVRRTVNQSLGLDPNLGN